MRVDLVFYAIVDAFAHVVTIMRNQIVFRIAGETVSLFDLSIAMLLIVLVLKFVFPWFDNEEED